MSEPILKAEHLGITFGGLKAVSDFNMTINSGELVGLIGPNGAGKTTVFNLLTGVYQPTEGEFFLDGERMNGKKTYQVVRAGIARTFQNIRLFGQMTVEENVLVAFNESFSYHMGGAICRTPKFWKQEREMHAKAIDLLKIFGLEGLAETEAANLPYGAQRKLEIARALATDPKVLLLDEPIASLDVSIQAGIINLLEDLQAKLKISYLFVAHDLAVIRHISDRVAVMYLGQVVELGETEDVFTHPRHPYTQALLSAIPVPDPVVERTRQRIILKGDLPSPSEKHPGCRFASRCPVKLRLTPEQQKMCETKRPVLTSDDQIATEFACHFPLDVNDESAPF